jgi:hypothetical protein
MTDKPNRELPRPPDSSDKQMQTLEAIAEILERIDGRLAKLSSLERMPDFEQLSHSIQDLAASLKKD